jgi:hypothetical protein
MAVTYKLISSTTLSSAQSQIVVSSIPSTYDDLSIFLSLRDASTNNFVSLTGMRFNSDSSSSYRHASIGGGYATGSNQVFLLGAYSSSVDNAVLGPMPTSSSLFEAGFYGKSNIYVSDYKAVGIKTYLIPFAHSLETTTSTIYSSRMIEGGGIWNNGGINTPAINSITFYSLSSANLIAGSSVRIYGISKT